MDTDEDGSHRRRTLKEEHVSMIQKPDSIFIGHVSTGRHKVASTTSESMLKYFEHLQLLAPYTRFRPFRAILFDNWPYKSLAC